MLKLHAMRRTDYTVDESGRRPEDGSEISRYLFTSEPVGSSISMQTYDLQTRGRGHRCSALCECRRVKRNDQRMWLNVVGAQPLAGRGRFVGGLEPGLALSAHADLEPPGGQLASW